MACWFLILAGMYAERLAGRRHRHRTTLQPENVAGSASDSMARAGTSHVLVVRVARCTTAIPSCSY